MKTSLFISSFAALCLLLTFAEAPRRYDGYKMELASATKIAIPATARVTLLPGVVITAKRNWETANTFPVIPSGNLNYLKFDVTQYLEADAFNPEEEAVLPDATSNDYSYLKYKISDYISGFSSEEITELPVDEYNSNLAAAEVNKFEYLKFDVNDYIASNGTETHGVGELPAEEVQISDKAHLSTLSGDTTELGYLKFDVANFYSSASLSSSGPFELPEK
ncbi:MAG: hypothetical protein Q7U54_10990 [Bacteroidales bacterium]|nr:hypothetical protein [Bacteroidales bacterium]